MTPTEFLNIALLYVSLLENISISFVCDEVWSLGSVDAFCDVAPPGLAVLQEFERVCLERRIFQ
jgi:hypothetical protein